MYYTYLTLRYVLSMVNSISCIKNSTRAWPIRARIMNQASERIKAKVLGFIHALLPLALHIGMAICYQYESAYFPAPYGIPAVLQPLLAETVSRL